MKCFGKCPQAIFCFAFADRYCALLINFVSYFKGRIYWPEYIYCNSIEKTIRKPWLYMCFLGQISTYTSSINDVKDTLDDCLNHRFLICVDRSKFFIPRERESGDNPWWKLFFLLQNSILVTELSKGWKCRILIKLLTNCPFNCEIYYIKHMWNT